MSQLSPSDSAASAAASAAMFYHLHLLGRLGRLIIFISWVASAATAEHEAPHSWARAWRCQAPPLDGALGAQSLGAAPPQRRPESRGSWARAGLERI